MARIKPTDFMIVNRDDVTYKINGTDVIDSFISELVLNEVIVSPTEPTTRDTLSATIDGYGGDPPYTIAYQWSYLNSSEGIAESNLDGATNSTLFIPDELAGYSFACTVTLTDSRGTSISKQSVFTSDTVLFAEPAVMTSVELTEVGEAPERFTSKTFNAQLTLEKDGEPASSKLLTAYTDGSFTQQLETDPIASFTESEPINYNLLLSTNDPSGVVNGYTLFQNYGDSQDLSYPFASVGKQYYIQFDFPDPLKWESYPEGQPGGIGFINVQSPPGGVGRLQLWLSDNITGRGGFRQALTWAASGYGAFAFTNYYYSQYGRDVTEIYAARWFDVSGNDGTFGFKQLGTSQQAFKNSGTYSGNGKITTTQYLSTDTRLIMQFAGGTNFDKIQVGDEIFQTGNSSVRGKVYKILENNTIELTSDSDPDSWTPGASITLPARPVPESRFYLVLDEDGNVLDLDTNKPAAAYTVTGTNPLMSLKFPATFPGGLTPDEELNAGTRLTVEATATNGSGPSNTVNDNLVPGGYVLFNLPSGTELPEAQAVNGYYPLYETEADANAAGNGSSHTHSLSGTTYYMPNGVTQFHGNYTGSGY